MWEVLLCTVSTVTLSEIRLLKKRKKKRKEKKVCFLISLHTIIPFIKGFIYYTNLVEQSSKLQITHGKEQIRIYTFQE